ncbi:MAG: 2,3-bisphosphoglycerate-independent phosphoglycerate mutase [Defluviitaleaceae bacterium]|nr:2,3-bisphosphoglycerate-independent phosphoglycerate mutase [Defluviitaleaceae bacterium]
MAIKPTVLMILDGYGLTDNTKGNAVITAKTPNLDKLFKEYPFAEGAASGLDVGLPEGQMGNSEVGHLNIGAGRIIYQDLTRITKSIEDGDFFTNEALLSAIENCKKHSSDLHLYGLLSDGGVHSHIEHLFSLLKLAKDNGLTNVFVHAFLDGRDTPPTSGKSYIEQLEAEIDKTGVGKIATVLGRFYAMDRDKRYERVQVAYDALVLGKGKEYSSAVECINDSYSNGVSDEFVVPSVIMSDDKPTASIKENDSIIFFNFRPDRAREITRCFCDPAFNEVKRNHGYFPLKYVCFTEYDETMPNVEVAYSNEPPHNTLGEYVSSIGLTQLRLAETEKYAHVTFFFNGGIEAEFEGEDRILVPSPKVETYDLLPEMSAIEVANKLCDAIKAKKHDLIIINFANPDMVGHTGVISAAVAAVETVDTCVGRAVEALLSVGGQMLLCSDHGNSEKMVDYETGESFTAHTTNPVPFVLINCEDVKGIKNGGKLCDISPTLLDMMGLEKPKEMTGHSLIIR